MDNDQPDLYEIEDMLNFCKKYKHIYILGVNEPQKYLEEFLNICGITIDGYIKNDNNSDSSYELNIYSVEKARKNAKYFHIGNFNKKNIYNTGILIIDNTNPYELQKVGFKNYFFVSDLNRRNIPYKLKPISDEKIGIEYNLTDHCNLNCKSCDHCSPIAEKFFITPEEFENDIKQLSKVTSDSLKRITLMGGEPLLHPQLIKLLTIARKYLIKTPIILHSNGILLLQAEKGKEGNLWQALKDLNIILVVTTYPVSVNYEEIDNKAKEYNIPYNRFVHVGNQKEQGIKWLRHTPFLLNKKAPMHYFISCYHFNECLTLRHGKIYTCPIKPYSQHFNKYFKKNLKLCEQDYLDIYKIENIEQIKEFCKKRTPFCGYCDIKNRKKTNFEISKKLITEWT